MNGINSVVEICQEASYCMLHPRQESVGWFLWVAIGLMSFFILSGLCTSHKIRRHMATALADPTEYRGRMGREAFLTVYLGLQTTRGCVIVMTVIGVALLGKTLAAGVVLLGGICLWIWLSAALYSAIIKRGHDFAFDGKESLLAYWGGGWLRFMLFERGRTWAILCNQKGNPYANRFGSAPEENNYLIPPEKEWGNENRTFPNVWDEADWKSTKPQPERKMLKRSHWKREEDGW